MLYFNFSYLWVLLPAMLFAIYAQSKVNSTFHQYSRLANRRGLTGEAAARALLQAAGIYDVQVERVGGHLTDHYDPRTKVLRLSSDVYDSTSLAAVGVAAHETGHAIQHAQGYLFLRLRTALVPISSLGSNLAMPMILLGLLFGATTTSSGGLGGHLIELGILFFSLAVLFTVITLPVEFNASHRAVVMLGQEGLLAPEELTPVKKVLGAAAMTYVAATASALASLLRLLLIFGGRDRD
ncbi:MAG: zinc metallopeptidase [Clostridiales bacterium]|nr:zinc metallopeptidase [Clostridiales bacterium]